MSLTPSPDINDILRNHVDLSENGLAVLDADNIFLLHNRAFVDMFGFSGQSMVGRSFDELLTWMYMNRRGTNITFPTLGAWLFYIHKGIRSLPFRRYETELTDGRWLLATEQIYASGHMVVTYVDITNQKNVEFELKVALQNLERLAQTDELTDIPNRRHFLGQLTQEVGRSKRYRHPLCLAMLDLDHFKQVNDKFGHPAGDQVLVHFAAFLRAHLRTGDLVGRIGGEEFAILLPETQLEDALFVLRRIRDLLNAERLESVTAGFSYTFSAGVAQISDDPKADCNWLLMTADKALYQAKSTGRNKVIAHV